MARSTPKRQGKPRQRDYKAEYQRRLARGRAQGKSRQQARGHARAEHIERKARTIRRYGMTPAELTRANKIRNHVKRLFPDGNVPRLEIYQGITAKGERFIIRMDQADARAVARLQGQGFADTYDEDGFITEAFNRDWNPLWYHGTSGGYEGGV